jgi:toxin ParE1/3/4
MARYTKTSEAYRDIVEQAEYLAERSLDAAMRFVDAVEATAEFLTSWPEMGEFCHFRSPRVVGLRVWQVRVFPNHLFFYRVAADGIEIVRVLHAARDYDSIFS